MGRLGLDSVSYHKMAPVDLYLAIQGHTKAEWQKWEHTRFLAYNVAATIKRKKGRRLPSMKRWLPLPQDKQLSHSESQDHMRSVFEKLKEKR